MNNYPLSTYHFQVDWGGSRLGFTEVSGLDITVDVIEYREGHSPVYSTTKMPGMIHYSNIVLKRGMMLRDASFFDWLNTIQLNRVERRDITITMLNEEHEPVMSWRAINAFPVKLEGPVLNAMKSSVAIETLEIAHEGLSMQTIG